MLTLSVTEISWHLGLTARRLTWITCKCVISSRPELTFLELLSDSRGASCQCFGGLAPRLQRLHLKGIPFPPPRGLLLSATDLGSRPLEYSYVSAEIGCLAAMVRLKSLFLGSHSPRSCFDPESQHPPPPIRTVLPALTRFTYRGACESLEDLVDKIDAPLLDNTEITSSSTRAFSISLCPVQTSSANKGSRSRDSQVENRMQKIRFTACQSGFSHGKKSEESLDKC